MKNKKKKILISILIIFILLFCLSGRCFAEENGIETAIDGVVGILLTPAKWFVLILGDLLSVIMGFFTNKEGLGLSLEDILFNHSFKT